MIINSAHTSVILRRVDDVVETGVFPDQELMEMVKEVHVVQAQNHHVYQDLVEGFFHESTGLGF